jgi:glycosyltransferase involved in cell wall biosynthesis
MLTKTKPSKETSVIPLSVVIITLNEERNLEDCLASVSFAGEIVVLDSGSKDRTREIAERHRARFFMRPFDNFASQKNAAMEKAVHGWILLLDADERITPELQEEILNVIQKKDAANGYFIRRVNHMFGGPMRYGASWGDKQLRLVKKGRGVFQGIIHERVRAEGRTAQLQHPMLHYSTQDLGDYLKRFSLYTSLEAQRFYEDGKRPTWFHLYLKPVLEFVYFYFFRLGFLDGERGLQYQVLSSYYTYFKYLKTLELFRENQ